MSKIANIPARIHQATIPARLSIYRYRQTRCRYNFPRPAHCPTDHSAPCHLAFSPSRIEARPNPIPLRSWHLFVLLRPSWFLLTHTPHSRPFLRLTTLFPTAHEQTLIFNLLVHPETFLHDTVCTLHDGHSPHTGLTTVARRSHHRPAKKESQAQTTKRHRHLPGLPHHVPIIVRHARRPLLCASPPGAMMPSHSPRRRGRLAHALALALAIGPAAVSASKKTAVAIPSGSW